jgi:hypothetical protein
MAGAVAPFMAGAILGASSPTVVFALSGTPFLHDQKIAFQKKSPAFYLSHFHLMFCTSYRHCYMTVHFAMAA